MFCVTYTKGDIKMYKCIDKEEIPVDTSLDAFQLYFFFLYCLLGSINGGVSMTQYTLQKGR